MKNTNSSDLALKLDPESELSLKHMAEQEQVMSNRLSGVKNILVILSSRGMAFDLEALRQKLLMSYPESAVFFQTTEGYSMGANPPERVDLLIDFTGPGQRQGMFQAKKLKKMAKTAVGRNAGFFRKKVFDRVYDEVAHASEVPTELLERERFVQKKVLNLAGVALMPAGETGEDRGKSIALELPRMQGL